ncbi:MAG: glycosyltransferase [Clostridia bacterium]|nr:glycosyltransferase [Clostridia bacterium]
MKKEPLISVIVPVRNVAVLLYHNIDTLLSQTYKNLEIILVEDESEDSSSAVCENIAKKDSRIKIIHQAHSGISIARNTGLDAATGEYIAFMDADDFISLNLYEYLYKILIENDADVAECDFIKTDVQKAVYYENFEPPVQEKEKVEIYTSNEALRKLHDDDLHTCIKAVVLWNKLYKRELWDGIRFPEYKKFEDEMTTYKILDKCKKVASSNQILYAYIQRNTFSMKRRFDMHRFDAIEAYDNYLSFFKQKKSPDMLERVARRYLRMLTIIRDEISPYTISIVNKDQTLQRIDQRFENIYQYLKELLAQNPELQDRQKYHQEYYNKYKEIIKFHEERNERHLESNF